MPDFTFPTVGRLDITSPPSQPCILPTDYRYYDPLRLPKALLIDLRSSLSLNDTLYFPFFLLCSSSGSHKGRDFLCTPGFLHSEGTPSFHLIKYKETFGPPKFPSYPFEYMTWSKTPVVFCALRRVGISTYLAWLELLPSRKYNLSAFTLNTTKSYPNDHNFTFFGAQYRPCILDPSSFALPSWVLHVDFTTNLSARL